MCCLLFSSQGASRAMAGFFLGVQVVDDACYYLEHCNGYAVSFVIGCVEVQVFDDAIDKISNQI